MHGKRKLMGSHAIQDTCKCCLKEAVMYWEQGWAQETQSVSLAKHFKCSIRFEKIMRFTSDSFISVKTNEFIKEVK